MISIREATGSTVLSGALRGQELLSRLLRDIAIEPSSPTPLFLDFTGIEVATASFLRESVLTFRDLMRSRRSNAYPVVANANGVVREELTELVKSRGDVLMSCSLTDDGAVFDPRLLGTLDGKQQRTFELVSKKGETDARELMEEFGQEEAVTVQSTAWNNRLASLVALGLIMEISQGRGKRYKPILQGV